ncbi:copper chaperone PCu(A)C [Natronospira bacteriovora]|uniref:Copper chaperone PCu(A)C n=1 Tax=Natronospira bacteriovora TaxID=3069753 RepID=A0ABU0W4G4_9GAMM|nr:copper chaperone PCu(A)C [Natronospira sp. AB-CW4]MDQ2068915.1 copper chaperone PCu(A)C [Natronospira sp. AB-CW4]
MKRIALFLSLSLCSLALTAEPPITAESPWVREAPPGTSVTAGYLQLHNRGDEAVSLTAVSADEFRRSELHETVHEDGQARMRHVDAVLIPAGGQAELAPGGKHIMLHEPRRTLEAGDWVTLTLRFDNGQLLQIAAPVRKRTGREEAGDDEHEHHHHGAHE